MGRGDPNPSKMGMRFDFTSTLGMGRVTGKYLRVGYGDGEGETRPHPALFPCLLKGVFDMLNSKYMKNSIRQNNT